MVTMEKIGLEMLAPTVVSVLSYGVTQIFTLTPFDKAWSRQKNDMVFCAVPIIAYAAFRIYFAIFFSATGKYVVKYSKLTGKMWFHFYCLSMKLL